MANPEQVELLKTGFESWNKWRDENPKVLIDLSEANLSEANLVSCNLKNANLSRANLFRAKFLDDPTRASIMIEGFDGKTSRWLRDGSTFENSDLSDANLSEVNASGYDFRKAKLVKANLKNGVFHGAIFSNADLSNCDFSGSNLKETDFSYANAIGSKFIQSNLNDSDLKGAIFSKADIRGATLCKINAVETILDKSNLSKADLSNANLSRASLIKANLNYATLYNVNFLETDLSGATLVESYLREANLINTRIEKATISGSNVYTVNVWGLEGEFKDQKELIITPDNVSAITVDNIKVAQFIYLLLNNKEIRDVINTLTSKTVLILGRFSPPERKAILDTLRNKLREYDLLPIVFDFDRPADKDFTETIKTLAGISYFVIADVTNPKSSPLELQATVPDYQIPFVPIIQEGESPFAMMVDLQKKYDWVLDTISYDSLDTLIEILKPHIIDPAIKMRDKLRLIKAQVPTIISGKELKEKGKKNKKGKL
jgi:uncharacterized protein YjbI with pentapeptide repeats